MPKSNQGHSQIRLASTASRKTTSTKPRRQATVYDAVAGRVSSTGFISSEPRVSKNRDTFSSTSVAVPPEEVLFRRHGAPTRYEENDIYWADKHLADRQKLPESDMLKAIHAYASDFYRRATKNKGVVDFESFDETALLGLGMLLEEMVREVLGNTGDMAFIEGEQLDNVDGDAHAEGSELGNQTDSVDLPSSSAPQKPVEAIMEPKGKRKRKKRKFEHGDGRYG